MNIFLRTLEDWTSYQDYVWFVATLAWLAVVFGARGRASGEASGGDRTWLEVVALGAIAGAVLELALRAQNLPVPYTKSDFAMGFAQAVGIAALSWPALERRWPVRSVRLATLAAAGLLAAARVPWPGAAGVVLALAGAVAAWMAVQAVAKEAAAAGWERRELRGLWLGLGLVGMLPAMATHGPLALALGEPRVVVDFSHLALAAAGLLAAAGGTIAVALWRWRLRSLHGGADLNRGLGLLALWLAVGFAFVVWSGRQARRDFEEGLLQRVKTGAALLDPEAVGAALGAELQAVSFRLRHDPDGKTVEMARIPQGNHPAFGALRRKLFQLGQANPDLASVFIETLRNGRLIVPVTRKLQPNDPQECVVYRPATAADEARLRAKADFLEGPVANDWGTHFYAKAALLDPATGAALGWLVLDVSSTRWTLSFRQARLQAMGLVGLGAGLWGLAIAYRLRRAEGMAATQRAVAAAAADRLKSAFLAKVSHELRTPLQSLLGYGELLERAALPPEQRSWVGALRAHGEVMLRLVNDLIDLGTLQAGAFRLRPGRVHLPQLAEECVAALRPRAEAKRLALSLECQAGAPEWVEADAVRLRQILLNLATNAVKYTERGGVRVTLGRGDGGARFTVRDTGPGIPPERRDELFRPFTRLTQDDTTEGSGVGLALVSGLCTAMGGGVRLEDDPAGGAVFVVELPLRELAGPAEAGAGEPRAALAGMRIVVADDNTLVRELLTVSLREHGAEVTAVEDGAAAVAACARLSPHAVVLDLAMPQLDGFGAARAIRAAAAARRPLLVGLSAQAQPGDEAAALAAGMDRFLTKPVRLAEFAAALQGARDEPAPEPPPDEPPPALVASLRAHYERETPAILSAMLAAYTARDWPELRRRAHYLKNSADVIGAAALAAACRALFQWAATPADRALGATLLAQIETAARKPIFTTPSAG